MPYASKKSDAEIVEILRAVKEHGSGRQAGVALGMSPATVHGAVQLAKARGLSADSKIIDEKEKLRLKNEELERRVKALQREEESAETIRHAIYGIAERQLRPPAWVKRQGGNGRRGAPMVLWSDWHRGEIVRAEEVAGVNEFNSEIHDKRVKRLVDTTIDLAFNHMGRAKTVYPGVVINLGGDFINGDIHDELVENADRTTQQNLNELTDLLAGAIDNMAKAFGKVFAPCVVGNHGRATLKPRAKGRVYTSHEWNVYCNLARHFRNEKHIRFMIPSETDAYYSVFGHRFLLTHGDSMGVKGGDGIIGALGPIARGALKVGRSEAQIGRDFDTILMGHWHQYTTLRGIIVNGALKGYDEYARLMLRATYERPTQALWFVHPEHGITAQWPVYLEDRPALMQSREWVSWAPK